MNLENLPSGYRFCPFDWELLVYYLKKKVKNEPLPPNRIMQVNLYDFTPDQLEEMYNERREKEMYFLTQRGRKYLNGVRPNRVTGSGSGSGYWKASAADNEVKFEDELVGFKRTLVFYRRTTDPKGEKTNWIMHEFRVDNPPTCKKDGTHDMKLDWVLCRIYKKVRKEQQDHQDDPMHLESANPSIEMAKPICNMSQFEAPSSVGNCNRNVDAYSENMQQQPLQNNCLETPHQMDYINYGEVDSIEYANPNQNNDFASNYNNGVAHSIQYACPSQIEALESMARLERPNCNMLIQAYTSADSMQLALQNNAPEIPLWSNNAAAIGDELQALDACCYGTSMAVEEPLCELPPLPQPSINPFWCSTYVNRY